MTRTAFIAAASTVALALPAAAIAQEATTPPAPVAVAQLRTADGTDAGTVTAWRGPLGLLFRVEGRNWPAGWHGVHLHTTGVCDGPGFTSAGGHVDHASMDRAHGLLNMNGGPELGDLQNVYAAADGTAMAEVYASGAQTSAQGQDLMDEDGFSFVVHANPDDHVSQPIGGAGPRIACGVFEPR
ncbi:MAG TPA: superoxide dismutase family protein [Brevundimonas sp.]|jgi:Cu-Zn family superoxide dismutase|uniref:superoxide dismutase family protein n=1 Tax=Brevundimonas sp. TaxID=1871086 RepID=UPI002E0E9555|nr:superoxide dismutase family protein [Brevundimonas sp.]